MKFNSLKSALQYKEICPYCKKTLEVANLPHSTAHPTIMGDKMYWREPIRNEYISIDLITEEMEISSTDRTQGTYYCALKITCELCNCYYHVFNLKFNLSNKTIEEIEINNYNVIFYDGGNKYQISNSKSFNQTFLIQQIEPTETADGTIESIEFPYVDIDIESPMNTLNKLKGLIVYL